LQRIKHGEEETSLANFPASDNSWDIRGSYKTECQEIEDGWSPQGDPTWALDLRLETRQGKQQLDGKLHFRVFEGVVRFEEPILVPKSESTSKKRKREVMGDDSDVEMDMLPEYKGMKTQVVYTEKVTFLGAKDKPSLLLEDLPGDIDGVGLRLEKVRFNSMQTKTFSPILSARWRTRGAWQSVKA
jgi:hypothetical protein